MRGLGIGDWAFGREEPPPWRAGGPGLEFPSTCGEWDVSGSEPQTARHDAHVQATGVDRARALG